MRVVFIFGFLIALLSIGICKAFVVQTPAGNNSTQHVQPNKKLDPSPKGKAIEIDGTQKPRNQNRSVLDQASKPGQNPAQNATQASNPAQNQTKQESKNQNPEEGNKKIIKTRRNWETDSKYKRFEVRNRIRGENNPDGLTQPKFRSQKSQKLESVVLAVETGAQKDDDNSRHQPDSIDRIEQLLQDLAKSYLPSNVIYRAKQDLDIKPSFIKFKSSEQPSLKLEVTSSTIMKALESILHNPETRRYVDILGQQAAEMYRSISNTQQPQQQQQNNLGN